MWRDEDGAALIVVTWIVLILSILSAIVLKTSLATRELAGGLERDVQDRLIAESAMELFLRRYFYDPDERVFRSGVVEVFGQRVTVDVLRESGKINLNRANQSLLSAVFAASGVDEDQAEYFAARIMDWRDRDSDTGAGGAEQTDYRSAGYDYGPRNGPLESVGELSFILDLSASDFSCVGRLFTVHSLSAEVDPEYASPEVRQVYNWAFLRDWKGAVWPDLDAVVPTGIVGSENALAGAALRLILTIGDEPERSYTALVRYRSAADGSYKRLGDIKPYTTYIRPETCPW